MHPTRGAARAQLYALLHDAPEYVMGDIISPFKAAMGGNYKEVENRLLGAVHLHFALNAAAPAAAAAADQEGGPGGGLSRGGPSRGVRGRRGAAVLRRAERCRRSSSTRFEQLIRPWPTREAHDRFVDAVDMLATAMHQAIVKLR